MVDFAHEFYMDTHPVYQLYNKSSISIEILAQHPRLLSQLYRMEDSIVAMRVFEAISSEKCVRGLFKLRWKDNFYLY